jgi:hypothetical protein
MILIGYVFEITWYLSGNICGTYIALVEHKVRLRENPFFETIISKIFDLGFNLILCLTSTQLVHKIYHKYRVLSVGQPATREKEQLKDSKHLYYSILSVT